MTDRARAETSQEIQVVDIVSRSRDHGMIPAVNQNCIAVVRLHNLLGVVFAAVQVLQGKACVLNPVIVNFVEVYF